MRTWASFDIFIAYLQLQIVTVITRVFLQLTLGRFNMQAYNGISAEGRSCCSAAGINHRFGVAQAMHRIQKLRLQLL